MKQNLLQRFSTTILLIAVCAISWAFEVDGLYYDINPDGRSVTAANAEGISVSPVTLEPGGIVPIPVNCNFSCEDITLYQFDLYLPEGVTLAKNNKGRYAVGTTYVLSDRHDEHTASLKDNTGFVRFVVSQNDGYLITPGEGLLLTLYVQADASVSGELQASIKNFMMFETDETKHAMSDVTFKMTVPAANIPVTGITLNKTTASLTSRGQTLQLTATVTPENATNKSVTWSSSNPSVATVDANGLVTAVASGSATITAKAADGSNKTATCAVTVNISVPVTGITLNQTTAMLTSKSQTLQLTATVTPENATNKSVTWSSSNTSVATVDANGLVTAVASGSATITAKTADGSNKTATCAVTVNISVPVTGITLNQTTATLTSRGQTLQLTATVTPDNATNKSVTWSSSNTSVATVDANGLVTAVSSGTATITAKTATTSDGSSKTATCAVTVNISVPASEGISVSPVTLEPGGIVPIPVNCNFSCEDITLYQFDLYLPEGVTLAKNNKDRYAAGTTYVLSDRHDEHTASLKDNTGFVRFVVSQNDGYLITPGEGLLLTLYVQADASVSGELQASIKNFMMFETDETKHAMSDVTFKMMVPSINQNIQFADAAVKAICVANWDTNGDGELSEDEAAQVKDIGTVFKSNKEVTSFDELQYFTGLASIGDSTFYNCKCLASVTIPCSVTSIGRTAFFGCNSLTLIDIPNNVTSIGISAFHDCSGLTSVTIPNSVTSISSATFYGCSGLTSVTIPNSVTSIGNYAFDGCKGLISVTIPYSVTSIGEAAFYGCSGLTSITIPNSVTSIGEAAFYGCSGLTSITIPNSVTIIGSSAFYGCSGLTSVPIPNSVTSIGNRAFYNCSGLTSVTIPNSVTSIESYAFKGCISLTSVTIPNSVTSIGWYAFYGCSGLTSVTIPNSVTWIGYNAFCYCNNLTSVTLNADGFIKEKFSSLINLGTIFGSQVEKYILGDKITSIGDNAFPSGANLYVSNKSALLASWNYGINPYDLSTGERLAIPEISLTNSASSIRALRSYTAGDADIITNEFFIVNGRTRTGRTVIYTGLTPGTNYPVSYRATMMYAGDTFTYTKDYEISTKSLTLTLSPPKVFSLGNAIVEATSNLDDDEENVGFEWRRMDWSDEMMSNRGVAYLYEGIMEGNIRNLNTEQYWKVRPYYMANDGTYYYGEWGGFDPANTSYFEPTVHTYSKIDQTDNKVQISGYVQRATDAVSKQGFKYWIQEDEGYARGAGVSIPTGARTVEAEGRVMEVELTGLMPNTTYAYVAFVTTVEGETFYGKQQSFTTGDDPAAAIVGDANGNGEVEIGDVTSVLTLMATPEATGYNNEAADANQNGEIEIGDVTTILTIMAGGE